MASGRTGTVCSLTKRERVVDIKAARCAALVCFHYRAAMADTRSQFEAALMRSFNALTPDQQNSIIQSMSQVPASFIEGVVVATAQIAASPPSQNTAMERVRALVAGDGNDVVERLIEMRGDLNVALLETALLMPKDLTPLSEPLVRDIENTIFVLRDRMLAEHCDTICQRIAALPGSADHLDTFRLTRLADVVLDVIRADRHYTLERVRKFSQISGASHINSSYALPMGTAWSIQGVDCRDRRNVVFHSVGTVSPCYIKLVRAFLRRDCGISRDMWFAALHTALPVWAVPTSNLCD